MSLDVEIAYLAHSTGVDLRAAERRADLLNSV
jgi:hypothetical protein